MVRTIDDKDARWGPWVGGGEQRDDSRPADAVVAPHDGRTLAQVDRVFVDEVASAVTTAQEAFIKHRREPAHVRRSWLQAAADAIEATADDLTDTLVHVLGKPRRMSAGEVGRGVGLLRLCAEELARFGGENLPLDATSQGAGLWGLTRREPFGVVGAITPFNAPVNLLLQKVAPALAVGNAVVVKPAPEGAIPALQVAEAMAEALPDGLMNVVTGGVEAAQALIQHDLVRAVSFTGGVEAGRAVLRSAGLKPVTLELGSNSPNIVCADADLDDAATRIAGAAFGASGQQCISAQRIIVEDSVAEAFTDLFVEAARRLVVGDPDDSTTDIGPLVSPRRKEHVDRFLADVEDHGGTILLDGRRKDDLMYGPTIVANAPKGSLIRCDEVFGPVAVIVEVDDLDAAITDANDSDFGLQAACFTRSLATAMKVSEEVEAGTVLINNPSRFRIDLYPFGGVKHSGIGREGVRYAMEAFSQLKTIALRRVS